ncbi:unnamed protein product [Linum trigynum]|uniref:UDP-glycosyltransferase 1 n=1 Tax=Linum trigynum TaxID=586398 RepID=A0AAV2D7I3_9ROSI
MNSEIPLPSETSSRSRRRCHVAAVPYPGRGHINPMLNLCKLLCSKNPNLLVTFVITEEWLRILSGGDGNGTTIHSNIRLASIPNVIPSELIRGSDFPAFYDAVMTKMESPFDQLLDRLSDPPVTVMISDTELRWAVRIGNRRNIPVATLCTVPARVFSLFHRFACVQNRDQLLDDGEEHLHDHSIVAISPPEVADLRAIFRGDDRKIMNFTLECISWVPKAQYLLVNSVHELEPEVFNSLRSEFRCPVYPIGPAIPFSQLDNDTVTKPAADYFQWLDSHPEGSVLYVSLGSFLSVSKRQMEEIVAGLRESSVPFLWVARGESDRLQESFGGGEKGMVVAWCDQLKVLNHGSVGGFWTHCGWNSTLEAVYGGVPMLTFPIIFDQVPNSRVIVEKWRIGWRLKRDPGGLGINDGELVTRGEICEIVKRFMDRENSEVREMRKRAKELGQICRQAIAEGGSSDRNLDDFISDVSKAC